MFGEKSLRHVDCAAQEDFGETAQSSSGPPDEGSCGGGGAEAMKDALLIPFVEAQITLKEPNCAQDSAGEGQTKSEELHLVKPGGKQRQTLLEGWQIASAEVRQRRDPTQVVDGLHRSSV